MSTDFVKGRWNDEECQLLKQLVKDFIRVDPNIDVYEVNRMIEQEKITIPWSIISKKMAKRSRLSCFKKWQKMTTSPKNKQKTKKNTQASLTLNKSKNIVEQQRIQQQIKSSIQAQQQAQIGSDTSMDIMKTAISVSAMTIPTIADTNTIHTNVGLSQTEFPLTAKLDDTVTTIDLSIPEHEAQQTPPLPAAPETSLSPESHVLNMNSSAAETIMITKTDDATIEEFDLDLLQQLSDLNSSGGNGMDSVIWTELRHPLGALERWRALLQEMQEEDRQSQNDINSHFLISSESPLYTKIPHIAEIAEVLLERKKSKKAAVLVEAVDIPIVGPLSTTITSSSTSST